MRPRRPDGRRLGALAVALALFATACADRQGVSDADAHNTTERIDLMGDAWSGLAIAYSGYRKGQSPDTGVLPSQEQITEDLRLLERTWRLIRTYAADRHGEDVLEVIRRESIDLQVMLGIWLAREPGAEERNARQIAEGIRLANAYPEIVVAVNVGNEVLIEWTQHPVPEARVLQYVRQVREAVSQPVTVADDYVWWRDFGETLAREVDFITMHSYPIWESKDIDDGMAYTLANYEEVRAAYPDKKIVIGEAGWATYTEGNLHVPRAGDETKQTRYYNELMDWARENAITVFYFEAFDEPWKGTGTEGYWGVFTEAREAKPVMQALYRDRQPDGPTSPTYPDEIVATGPGLDVPFRGSLAEAVPDGSVNPLGPGLAGSGVVPADAAEGGTALKLAFTGESWGGVYFILNGYDASAAETLKLRLALPEAVTALEVKLEGPVSNARSVNLIDFAESADEAGWKTFSVPLARLDGVDLTQVAVLGLWNPSDRAGKYVSGDLLVDDLRFE